jgi:integrase
MDDQHPHGSNAPAITRQCTATSKRSGVPFATTHGLRHMAATLMLQAGTSPALVASKIGHKDIGLTVNTYGHIKAQDHSSANAAVEAYLARANRNGTDE